MVTSAPVSRGCGFRVQGGVYFSTSACHEITELCRPLTDFIIDPPEDISHLPVARLGSTLIEAHGTYHVLDVVGRQHYPNVADFVEEAKRFGISRRASSRFEFGKLTPKSRLLLAHERAIITNPYAYRLQIVETMGGYVECPRGKHANDVIDDAFPTGQMCAGLWWYDLDGRQPLEFSEHHIGDTTYHAYTRPDIDRPTWKLGIFLSVPIGAIEVIHDQDRGTHEDVLERIGDVALPVNVVPW